AGLRSTVFAFVEHFPELVFVDEAEVDQHLAKLTRATARLCPLGRHRSFLLRRRRLGLSVRWLVAGHFVVTGLAGSRRLRLSPRRRRLGARRRRFGARRRRLDVRDRLFTRLARWGSWLLRGD